MDETEAQLREYFARLGKLPADPVTVDDLCHLVRFSAEQRAKQQQTQP